MEKPKTFWARNRDSIYFWVLTGSVTAIFTIGSWLYAMDGRVGKLEYDCNIINTEINKINQGQKEFIYKNEIEHKEIMQKLIEVSNGVISLKTDMEWLKKNDKMFTSTNSSKKAS